MIEFEYSEQISEWISTDRLIHIINDSKTNILNCCKDRNEHGIFRIIVLKSEDILYIFYGAGYHDSEGYIYDRWYFDFYLNYLYMVDNNYSKKSIINTIKLESSWFEKKSKTYKGIHNNCRCNLSYYREV
jgi:hypothetical protein